MALAIAGASSLRFEGQGYEMLSWMSAGAVCEKTSCSAGLQVLGGVTLLVLPRPP